MQITLDKQLISLLRMVCMCRIITESEGDNHKEYGLGEAKGESYI